MHRGTLPEPVTLCDLNQTTGDILVAGQHNLHVLSANGVLLASLDTEQSIKTGLLKSSLLQHDDDLVILGFSDNQIEILALKPQNSTSDAYRKKYSRAREDEFLK